MKNLTKKNTLKKLKLDPQTKRKKWAIDGGGQPILYKTPCVYVKMSQFSFSFYIFSIAKSILYFLFLIWYSNFLVSIYYIHVCVHVVYLFTTLYSSVCTMCVCLWFYSLKKNTNTPILFNINRNLKLNTQKIVWVLSLTKCKNHYWFFKISYISWTIEFFFR